MRDEHNPTYYHYASNEKKHTWTQLYKRELTGDIHEVTMEEQAQLKYRPGWRFSYYGAQP